MQYPGVADSLRADLDDEGFVRKLAGSEVGRAISTASVQALADAVRGELDYRAEAVAQERFRAAWADHPVLRIPRVFSELSSGRVLTMERAPGKSVLETAASGSPDVRRQAQTGIYALAWGSPLVHRLLNADPNPGNFLVEELADGAVHVWCLDFGCTIELPDAVRDADRELWYGLLDEDNASAAERFRMGLARSGLLTRTDMMATVAHREWEKALVAPLATHGSFHWSPQYARDLAQTTGRVLAAGGVQLPAKVLMLWRQRLGAAAVIGMLDGEAPFRRVLLDLIGTGRRALR